MPRNHGKTMRKFILTITYSFEKEQSRIIKWHTMKASREIHVWREKKWPRMSMFPGDRNLKGNTLFNLGKNKTTYVWYLSRISALILRVWNTIRHRHSCRKKNFKVLRLYHLSYCFIKLFTRSCLWDNEQLLKYVNTRSTS